MLEVRNTQLKEMKERLVDKEQGEMKERYWQEELGAKASQLLAQ